MHVAQWRNGPNSSTPTMARFRYTATQFSGEQSTGVLTADTRLHALQQLATDNLLPLHVHEESADGHARSQRVGAAARSTMFCLLADLLESGVPLLKSLDILVEQTSNLSLNKALESVRGRVASGQPLAAAMSEHPAVFHELEISLVHAGEEGGFLEESLTRAARLTERQDELRGRVIGALAYPAFLVVVGGLVVAGMITFFVPKFAPMFDRMRSRSELPMATEALLATSDFLRANWSWLAICLLFLCVILGKQMRTKRFGSWWDSVRLRLPGIGAIERSMAIARFCRVLGTLLSNGVPVVRSLGIAKDAAGNTVIGNAVASASDSISSGKTLAIPLAASGQFPKDLTEMISVGEHANRLETVLLSIANKLESRTERQLDVMVKLLEPVVMLVMAIIIGFLVVALLLPVMSGSGAI